VALAAGAFVYGCLARPGVLSGYVDYFIFSTIQKITARRFKVDDFEVQGQLGKGNFGSVFQAILVAVRALSCRHRRRPQSAISLYTGKRLALKAGVSCASPGLPARPGAGFGCRLGAFPGGEMGLVPLSQVCPIKQLTTEWCSALK